MKISVLRFGLLSWLAVILMLYIVVVVSRSSLPSDFAIFYASTQFLLEGKNVYALVPVDRLYLTGSSNLAKTIWHPNLNPPFFNLMLSPLGMVPYTVAFWIWSVLSLGFGVFGVTLLQRSTGKFDIDYILTLLVLLLVYFPVLINFNLGQMALMVFALLAGGWVAARTGRDRLSGVLLGLAFSIKIFLGLFAVLFLFQRRWLLLFWLIGIFVMCSLVGLAVLGSDGYRQYSHALGSVTWQSENWNASAYGFFSRIFGGSESSPLFDFPALGKVLNNVFVLLMVIGMFWLGRARSYADPDANFDLAFSYTLVAALLISPLGWMYYFPMLFIPVFVLFRLSFFLPFGTLFKVLLLAVFGVSGFPQFVVTAADTRQIALTQGAFYFYALVALASLIMAVSYALKKKGSEMISKPDLTVAIALERTQLLYGFIGLVIFYILVSLMFLL